MNIAEQVQEKILKLEELVTAKAPGLPTLLRDIHSQLKKDPEMVTLLSDEDCSILVRGLKEQTKTTIAVKAVKSKGGKAASKITLADL